MATWTHGYCIATCKLCNKPVLYSDTMILKTSSYDPMTSIKIHYKKFHKMFWEQFFTDMKIPHPMLEQLVNIKPRKHIIQGCEGNCWCGQFHRKVRLLVKHGYRKQSLITLIEDMEKP